MIAVQKKNNPETTRIVPCRYSESIIIIVKPIIRSRIETEINKIIQNLFIETSRSIIAIDIPNNLAHNAIIYLAAISRVTANEIIDYLSESKKTFLH